MKIMAKEATEWINPLNVYYDARCRAQELGATIVLDSDHDEIYQINLKTHMAPFCTTSNPTDMRGNTPGLIKLPENGTTLEWIKVIEDWIAKEQAYQEARQERARKILSGE